MKRSGQEEVFAFLASPATHDISSPVKRIDTHAASVFLAGPDVYKVKRAVRYPFLDQTTLERRRAACETELAVNRRFTPELYLGAVPITREGTSLSIDGSGEVIEWAVHLKRFDETRTLDLVAERGEMTSALIAQIADMILASHRQADVRDGALATAALAAVVDETLDEILQSRALFPFEEATRLADRMRSAFEAVRALLLHRGARGYVRRCHGDLHMRNIAQLDGGPILFDAIEFDESIATTDILYDLAFAVMDLWRYRLKDEANLLLNRYLWRCDDLADGLAGLAALPVLLSLRAAVLAKIGALRFRDANQLGTIRGEAQRYFDLAAELLTPAPPVLVAIGGLSGSGKSVVAAKIAAAIGRAPGAVHLRSDIERKRQFGGSDMRRLPKSAYRRSVSDNVFAALRAQAGIALRAGHSVIVDGVHRDPHERRLIAEVASRTGARFVGLWLDAPIDMLIERVARRTGDVSDATRAVVKSQAKADVGEMTWTRIDASARLGSVVAEARRACGSQPLD